MGILATGPIFPHKWPSLHSYFLLQMADQPESVLAFLFEALFSAIFEITQMAGLLQPF